MTLRAIMTYWAKWCLTGMQPGARARQVPSARVGGWSAAGAAPPGSDPPTPPEDSVEEELQQLEGEQEDPYLQVDCMTTVLLLLCHSSEAGTHCLEKD